MNKNVEKTENGERELFPDYSMFQMFSRSSSLRMNELSPGLLDLHSFDTELLPEVALFYYIDYYEQRRKNLFVNVFTQLLTFWTFGWSQIFLLCSVQLNLK